MFKTRDTGEDSWTIHDLSGLYLLHSCSLPARLLPSSKAFEQLWQSHPIDYSELTMHGRKVLTPRWQQSYGKSYRYAGQTNQALPLPMSLLPFLLWGQINVDQRLNGILVNWYDGTLGHYIGKHRDSTQGLLIGSPIVTISLGEERIFRLRPYKGSTIKDIPAKHGTCFIMPWETNLAWTHEVPKFKRHKCKRISVTLRAFV